ncbi:SLC13 family permease, partial [Staphylococcus epidermidis]
IKGSEILGTNNALTLAFSGFSTSAVALVAAALFLAAAMQETNLHKRLALLVLSVVGNKTKNIVIGAILVSIVLAFFVP